MSGNFSIQMQRFSSNASSSIDRTVKGIILELGRRIIEYSPVGDARYWQSPPPPGYVGGHFRANWQYGFNSQPQGQIAGVTNDFNGRIQVQLSHTDGIHYIINNVPYSVRLENGWSRQAPGPNAVVGRAVLSFGSIVRQEANR